MHLKNLNALLKYKNINLCIINDTNDSINDIINNYINDNKNCIIYSPCLPINVSKYPNVKFIFGPHFSVFPEKQSMDIIRGNKNVIYVQPSDWARDVWRNNYLCNGIRIETLSFGVNTDKFCEVKPKSDRNQVFIYFKRRNPHELTFIQSFLKLNNINYRIFDYTKKYSQEEYLDYLQNAKYGIWLGSHESQGFALQEALSCNVPLLVWNVFSMNQEYGSSYQNIPATTISYWDSICGEYFNEVNDFFYKFKLFISKLNIYNPRQFILDNLSIEKCEEKFINILKSI